MPQVSLPTRAGQPVALHAPPQEHPIYRVFPYLSKRSDLSPDAFIDYYENHHVPLVLSLAPRPPVYKRNCLVRGHEGNREDPSIDFDVITELAWDDASGFEEWITKLGGEEIAIDEGRFLDRARTRAYVIEGHASSA